MLLGVILVIKNDKGETVAEVKVPDGNTAEVKVPAGGSVQVKPDDTPAKNNPPQPVPPKTIPPKTTPPANTTVAVATSTTAPPLAVAPFDATKAKQHQQSWASYLKTDVVQPNSVGMQMTLIPPGEFLMGSSDADIALALKIAEETKLDEASVQRIQDERPQHKVRITQPFRLAAHEVTIGQFAKFVEQAKYKTQAEEFGGNSGTVKLEEVKPDLLKITWRTPGQAVTDDSPVTQVSWNDTVAFCNWLSGQEQLTPCYQPDGDSWTLLPKANGYRLPTEAEWEYSCRAGTTTQYSFGDNWQDHDKYGWSKNNSGGRPHSVGLLPANPFGLHDMHGNVWEWCQDWYDGKWYEKSPSDDPVCPIRASNRVLRGGSWSGVPAAGRSSYRLNSTPSDRGHYRGFRPALSSVGAQSSTASVTASTPPVVTPPPVAKPVGPAPPLAVAPFDAAGAKAHQAAWAKHLGIEIETPNSVGQKMVLIPPGEFLMGSTDAEVEAALKAADEIGTDQPTKDRIQKNERPQHKVVITKPLLMSATEVTIGQFKQFAAASSYQTEAEKGELKAKAALPPPTTPDQPPPNPIHTYLNPGYVVTDDSPAAVITWNDAVAYCNWLSVQEKLDPCYRPDGNTWQVLPGKSGYRLPTEAEWEYASRAGTTTQFSFGDDHQQMEQFGWYSKNSGGRSHAVGTKLPNPFGLFDMHGNLQEWCQDFYDEKWYAASLLNDPSGPASGSPRVIRGGNWNDHVSYCRSAPRYNLPPSVRGHFVGFRCVRVWDTPITKTSVAPTPPPNVTPDSKPSPTGTAPPLAVAPFDATKAKQHQQSWASYLKTEVVQPNSIGMQMTLIPPGEFLMGSSDADIALALKIAAETKLDAGGINRIQEERPQHRVRITQPFRLAAHEVTIGQFAKFVEQAKYKTQAEEFGGNSDKVKPEEVKPENLKLTWRTPGQAVTDDSPVTQVSWNDAVAFCNWLSVQEQLTPCYQRDGYSWTLLPKANGYRLPTEAEWEYCCRAGTTTQFWFGDNWQDHDNYGWSEKNAGGRPHAVGSLPASPFGLYDMHGNVSEWCHDWYDFNDGKWYEKSPSDDPVGPSRGSNRVLRGGSWDYLPAHGRSSYRSHSNPPSLRHPNRGFRPALGSVGAPSITASVTPQPAVPAAASGKLFMHDPAFPQWMKDVQAMSADKQIEAVSKKLVELNPGFDGKLTGVDLKGPPKIENGVVTEIAFSPVEIIDISPVRALPGLKRFLCGVYPGQGKLSDLSPLEGMRLTSLNCTNTQVSDLSPLNGMSLTELSCEGTRVFDLSTLQGMPLTRLTAMGTKVSDLTPLKGMPLKSLHFMNTKVSDLSPLQGMPLEHLGCQNTSISDLSPLMECKTLKELHITRTKITPAAVADLQKALPKCKIEWNDPAKPAAPAPADSGKLFMHDPAFPQWLKDVQALPAEQQIEAVSKKLVELNPGFDGKITGPNGSKPTIENGIVTLIEIRHENMTDISPVRALSGLKNLYCGLFPGKSKLTDLSPLQGLSLTHLDCKNTQVSDLSPLKGMPLQDLTIVSTNVTDLTPLQGMPLTTLNVAKTQVSDLTPLQGVPLAKLDLSYTQVSSLSPLLDMNLTSLQIGSCSKVSDLSPLRGMKLTTLSIYSTKVSDLSPLAEMPLSRLSFKNTPVSDLSLLRGMPLSYLECGATRINDFSPLEDCKSLKTLLLQGQKSVTPAAVAALQKALPNCKIEWNDPAKPAASAPAESGTK